MELRRVAPVVGLCALLAADAVLIAWAFRGPQVDEPLPAASVRSATASPTTTTPAAKALKPAPVEQAVSVVGPDIAWVVRAGTCKAPGTVFITDDTGATWQSQPAPGRVLRARPASAASGFVTGGDAKCALKLWSTADAGRTWGPAKAASAAWTRMPDDAKAVHTPDDAVTQPCGTRRVLDLVGLTATRATVLCDNGDVRVTTDRGVKWSKAFTLAGSLAVTEVDNGSGVIVRTDESCTGVVAVPLVGSRPDGGGVCVRGAFKPGEVSVSGTSGAWWLVVGSKVFTAEAPVGPWRATKGALGG